MDAHLFLRDQLRAPVLVPVAGGTAIAFTAPSPTPEDRLNEDGVGVFGLGPDTAVFAVADGVGGHGKGDLAARTALEAIANELAKLSPNPSPDDVQDPRGPVMDAIERANQRLLGRVGSPATTLVVATLHRGDLRCYTVGDSELMVVGQRGKLKLRTIPHSPVGYARESGMLDEAEALLHDERHLLSNVLGMEGMHMAATASLSLAPRDTVLLGSDGLFDNLFHDEIIEIIRAGELFTTAEELLRRLRQRMSEPSEDPEIPSKPDDLSFVLFRPQPPPARTLARAARAQAEVEPSADPSATAEAEPRADPDSAA